MKILLIYGPGEENCKQTLVHLLLDRLERYSLIETVESSLYTSVVCEPEDSRTGPYADSRALNLIKVHALEHERIEGIKQGVQLAGGADGLIILANTIEDYPEADFKIAVPEEGDNTELPGADFIYRLREDLDNLIVKLTGKNPER